MKINKYPIWYFVLLIIFWSGCKQQYFPPVAKSNLGYLVVDGIILNGQDSTVFKLSRTKNLTDSTYTQTPETGAQVSVVGQNSEIYPLVEQGNGRYAIDQLNLNLNETYQLKIITSNGDEYLSDTLSTKTNPPIDSVSWVYSNDGVQIYVSTHDPLNNTKYYKWDYAETWQYRSAYDSYLIYQNGAVISRDTNQHVYSCWRTSVSTALLLATSANLTQDVIFEQPVTFIPLGNEKIGVEYSILVKQYALSKEAFNYWQTLQKNTEQTGSLFDPQPSQLTGNIHNTHNSNEPVLGYVSISAEQEKRIFINRLDLGYWPYQPPSLTCSEFIVTKDSIDYYYQKGFMPIDNTFPSSIGYISSTSPCVDCTIQGGVTIKPAYWP
jgi:hypothetical protein